ncbi:MAG: hypothetical protein HQ567_23845 [Candidatus Nealsonbacteria bacterium]|nr:hypothetical protein [Candidatus Nealsonbacteria bacterium]
MSTDEYMNQTELGELFGATSHTVGKWLMEVNLRTFAADGKRRVPSSRAFDDGFITKRHTDMGYYNYVWHAEKTIAALEEAGHERIDVSVHPLAGPFSLEQTGSHTYQIVNKDGTSSLRGLGMQNMDKLLELMNLAHKFGKLE